jgi:hypothetical protein
MAVGSMPISTSANVEDCASVSTHVAVAGPPREAGGYPVALKQITFRLKGSVRARIKGRPRRRALLTNPASCGPASTALDVFAYDGLPPMVTMVSTFTLTGC